MDRWQNKVAVVSGASSGIGADLVKKLAESGITVVGLARRKEKVLEIRETLPKEQQSRVHAIKCDVTKEEEVKQAFDWIEKYLGGTDILINNAGVARNTLGLASPNNTSAMKEVIETNVMGVLYCTREAFNSMNSRNFDGHIIVMNSVLGHKVANFIGTKGLISTNMYSPSKYAVTAMVETYRQEFINAGTKVRITSISPGMVDTELISERTRALKMPMLKSEDISQAIFYAISTPPHVQVHDIIIRPVGERV